MQYSKTVMDHFANPRNVGELDDADGIGEVGNAVCGDMMTFYIKVKDDRIEDVKFKTFGCGAAIAVSSMVSEMAKGMTLDEAAAITKNQVAENLEGLPKNKMHCSNLGTDALKKAIENFRNRDEARPLSKPPPREEPEACVCPHCGGKLEGETECAPCRVLLDVCPSCGKVVYENHACKSGECE